MGWGAPCPKQGCHPPSVRATPHSTGLPRESPGHPSLSPRVPRSSAGPCCPSYLRSHFLLCRGLCSSGRSSILRLDLRCFPGRRQLGRGTAALQGPGPLRRPMKSPGSHTLCRPPGPNFWELLLHDTWEQSLCLLLVKESHSPQSPACTAEGGNALPPRQRDWVKHATPRQDSEANQPWEIGRVCLGAAGGNQVLGWLSRVRARGGGQW